MKKIKRILQILDNITYWDTCPDDYRTDIIEFLNSEEAKQLRLNASSLKLEDIINNYFDEWKKRHIIETDSFNNYLHDTEGWLNEKQLSQKFKYELLNL